MANGMRPSRIISCVLRVCLLGLRGSEDGSEMIVIAITVKCLLTVLKRVQANSFSQKNP